MNYNGTSSELDGPPSSYNKLTITPSGATPDRQNFDVGDHYDLTFQHQGKTYVLNNAEVIRSETTGNSPLGAILTLVFEGMDTASHEIVHVLWTPGMDLDSWYDANSTEQTRTGFYTSDRRPGDFPFACFASDAMVATPNGAVAANDLRVGDMVETLTTGPQPVIWMARRSLALEGIDIDHHPLRIEADAFGRGTPDQSLCLSQQLRVLVNLDGERYLVPARGLLGRDGVERVSKQQTARFITLMCPIHSVIQIDGLQCESFFPGREATRHLSFQESRRLEQLFPGVCNDPSEYGPLCYPHMGSRLFKRLADPHQPNVQNFVPPQQAKRA